MKYFRKSAPFPVYTARGFPERDLFRHWAAAIPKQYPDTFLLLERRGVSLQELHDGEFVQINVYSDQLEGFPDDLFIDRQINWHNQQMGQRGLIASAGLYLHNGALTITVMQSDLCQQLYRHAALKAGCKTQIEKRFGHWHRILFNAILDFAASRGIAAVRCPTSRTITGFTAKRICPALFERIYDLPARHYRSTRIMEGRAEYWEVRLSENTNQMVGLEPTSWPIPAGGGASICIFHDTEEDIDTDISPEECRRNLTAMLEIEKKLGVSSTYTVLGALFKKKRDEIWNSDPRHSLGFHSFNHNLEDQRQLTQCREVDLQVRGYRPPRSVTTEELTDFQLSYLNFEWFACGKKGLKVTSCIVENGIAKIPIRIDDHLLFTKQIGYEQWENGLLEMARDEPFLAFGLHDCYAAEWLSSYADLLEKLASTGTFVTADQVADCLFWEAAIPG